MLSKLSFLKGLQVICVFLLAVKLAYTYYSGIELNNTVRDNSLKILKDDHNIDIDPLDRSPSLTPSKSKLATFNPHDHHGTNSFIIASDLQTCNNIVKDMIETYPGVNYADASISIGLCLGMINFFNSGVGGGGYATLYDYESRQSKFYDFRETAPSKWDNEIHNLTKIGGLSIATPGELKGFATLFENHGSGKITFKQILEPIVKLGREGFVVEEVLGATLEKYVDILEALNNANPDFNIENWKFIYSDFENRKPLKHGDIMYRKAFADTLEYIGDHGVDKAFYSRKSPLVQKMVSFIQNNDGILDLEDFEKYKVLEGDTLEYNLGSNFFGKKVITSSGSSSGFSLISGLKIMNTCGLSGNKIGNDMEPKSTFQLIETMKWMGSARTRLGDYFYNESSSINDYPERISKIYLNDEWTAKACKVLNDPSMKTLEDVLDYDPKYIHSEAHGTSHYSIMDDKGNAIALTTTVNLLCGSLLHDPETGMIFNNEMDDFSSPYSEPNSFGLLSSEYNVPQPIKRPLSSMAPTIVVDELGRVEIVIGASGGSRITTSIFQALIRLLFYKMPLLETIAYPRVHHQLMPDVLEIESYKLVGNQTIGILQNTNGYETIESVGKAVLNGIHRTDRNEIHAVGDYWRKRCSGDIVLVKS